MYMAFTFSSFLPGSSLAIRQCQARSCMSTTVCLSVCLLFASGMKRVEEHVEEAVGKSDLA
jgi:hypothetical protein